ncbi:MAG: DegT/DnrJ/EryC1/StrS family aminotransferase [Bacteroidales bacterium]|nr:DegT/DnrJ/EryC1/StrS family aminotransferase [Bacteroidales bacterium]
MKFIDLNKQYEKIKDEINYNINKVIKNANFIMGDEVQSLERELTAYVGVKHCITCANGTDALSLVLMAWDIKKGDAVFVPTFTFFATAEAVSLCGATPIFIDIDPNTFNIDVDKLEKAIKAVIEEGKLNPRAIIPVDLFGQSANYPAIMDIAKKYNLLILSDSAQGFGGSLNGQMNCSFGDAAITSFFPAKPLGCYGDGGAIFTNDDKLAEILKSLRVHGKGSNKYDNVRIGVNSRLDNIQAAILLPKLKLFEDYELQSRNIIAQKYNELLSNIVITPYVPSGYISSWAQYSIIFKNEEDRNKVKGKLKDMGIPSVIYYEIPLHLQTAYKNNKKKYVDLSTAENICKRILSLPMHPYLEDNEIKLISTTIKKILGER